MLDDPIAAYRRRAAEEAAQKREEAMREKVSENALGRKWWNNGTINKFTKEKPEGDEWKEGRLLKKSK